MKMNSYIIKHLHSMPFLVPKKLYTLFEFIKTCLYYLHNFKIHVSVLFVAKSNI